MKLLIFFVIFAASPLNAQPFVERVSLESQFQAILQTPAPGLVMQEELQEMLMTRYRGRIAADTWRTEVHSLALRASKEEINIIPTQLETYQRFLKTENEAAALGDRIRYFYRRLLQTSLSTNVNQQLKVVSALNEIDKYLVEMKFIDQIQIDDLINSLRELRMMDAGLSVGLPNLEKLNKKRLKLEMEASQNIFKQRLADAMRTSHAYEVMKKSLPSHVNVQRGNGVGPARVEVSESAQGQVDGLRFPPGVVSLTFDDGPDPQYTRPIVRLLNGHHDRLNSSAPASFFWQAKNVINFPDVVKEIVAQPQFTTNCHSWDHANLTEIGPNELRRQVIDAIRVERQAFGRDFKFYRCPGGACSGVSRKMMYDQHVVHAFWSIDSLDWKLKDADAAFTSTIEQLKISKRGIILMHDIHPFSVVAAEKVLKWIKEQNDSGNMELRLYTLDEAVDLQNQMADKTVGLKEMRREF